MRYVISLLVLMVFPGVLLAAADQDRGILQGFLEDNLSAAGRVVSIKGFEGALSSRATIEELTIADDDGVWLIIRKASFDWNRAAILRRELSVNELAAEEILFPRLPKPGDQPASVPSPQASGFSLPQLPVSIDIAKLSVGKFSLGEALLGEAAAFTLSGGLSLADGKGDVDFRLERTDGQTGRFALVGGFSNATGVLAIDLLLSEQKAGIVANLLKLPGLPSVDMKISGQGPLDNFSATLGLSTDGKDRLSGKVEILSQPELDAEGGDFAGPVAGFRATLAGDITPLFLPEFRPFLGQKISLKLDGKRFDTGDIELTRLELDSAAARLTARLRLGPNYWPKYFSLQAGIIPPGGQDYVVLPQSGPQIRVSQVNLSMDYDAESGDEWAVSARLTGLETGETRIGSVVLAGNGRIRPSGEQALGRVDGDLKIDTDEIEIGGLELGTLLQDGVAGQVRFTFESGAPLKIDRFSLAGRGVKLDGGGTISGLESGLALAGEMAAKIEDLSQLSGISNMPLSGAADLKINGQGDLLGGRFDVALNGATRDLKIGMREIDGLFAGQSRLSLGISRSLDGTKLTDARLSSPWAEVMASGDLSRSGGDLKLEARIREASVIFPDLRGPIEIGAGAVGEDNIWSLTARGRMAQSASFDLSARVAPQQAAAMGAAAGFSAQTKITARDLSQFSRLSGLPLAGSVELAVSASGLLDASRLEARIDGTATNLAVGVAAVDRILAGDSRVAASVKKTGDRIYVESSELVSPELTATASGQIAASNTNFELDIGLRDGAIFMPELAGPISLKARAGQRADAIGIMAEIATGAGAMLQVDGNLSNDFTDADLKLVGAVPLVIANNVLEPLSLDGRAEIDLTLKGKPSLGALAGRVTIAGARFSVPPAFTVFTPLNATLNIAGGQANLDASALVKQGGSITVGGRIDLLPPFRANIATQLNRVRIKDPALFTTQVSGEVVFAGALSGGATISGSIDVEETEFRIPSGGGGSGSDIEGLVHMNETSAGLTTRKRAGFVPKDERAALGPGFGLDMTVNAPRRIFIRGRGLDVELGGRLRLRGTTNAISPLGELTLLRGRFDLLGQRLEMEEASIALEGNFVPTVRIVARSEVQSGTVRAIISGPVDEPEIKFVADPELPEDEALAQLLFGRPLADLSAFQAAQLVASISELSGRTNRNLVNDLRKGLGLDDIRVDVDDAGTTELRVGKYLTEDLYSDFTVDSEGTSKLNLNYDVTRSLKARGSVGSDGDSSIGFFFEREY